jgi:hypothetical protein
MWGKKEGNENIRKNMPITDYHASKTSGECGIFQLLG